MKTLILFCCLLFPVAGLLAQVDDTTMANILGELDSEAGRTVPDNPGGSPALDNLVLSHAPTDTFLQQKYTAAIAAYYQYRTDGYQHRHEVFRWQLLSSKVIFFVVLVLVLAGIYFSGVQFHHGLKNNATGTTELEASTTGIKVSSPVLGVIILVLSFLFFYLYLVYIYPIQEIF